MSSIFYLFIFIFGLTVGSFLNCVIYRLEHGESFLKGRSYCPHCKHKLGFFDLIPVLSFFWLRGLCSYCHKKISIQYPLVEFFTALIFLAIGLLISDINQPWLISDINKLYLMAVSAFLVVIFVYDLKHYIIPDKIIFPAIAVTLVYNFWKSDFLLSAFGAAAFFLAIVLVSKGKWMGVGDIKLAFLMGLVLGWPNILAALFLSFLIGAIIGLGLIIWGKKTIKSEVPFGPFLTIGTLIALFWGGAIISWYLQLFVF
ncbi:MAG: prepilin peptidase [Candidatus Buchananbacteria bacterium]|nr:prepilin peptidase [Candidatus Buchananbacteria bacterium]